MMTNAVGDWAAAVVVLAAPKPALDLRAEIDATLKARVRRLQPGELVDKTAQAIAGSQWLRRWIKITYP